jgi:predicted GNAT family N-acyltransferase
MGWVIERLASHHDRKGFDCGHELLNNFILQLAGQYARKDLGQTYVATRPETARVLGYYTISTAHVSYETVPEAMNRGLPRRIRVPVVLLGRLAVDASVQGQGLGAILLGNALERVADLAHGVGIRAITVEAIDDQAVRFYRKHGFLSLTDDERHLLLPVARVREMLAKVNLEPRNPG